MDDDLTIPLLKKLSQTPRIDDSVRRTLVNKGILAFTARRANEGKPLHVSYALSRVTAMDVAQVHERNPTGIRRQEFCNRSHLRFQNLHSLFDLVGIGNLLRDRHRGCKHMAHLADKVGDALFAHSRKRNARYAVEIRKFIEVL